MTVSHGKPYAGNPHVRFDEGADVPDEGRSALLHQFIFSFDAITSRRDAENAEISELTSTTLNVLQSP